MPARKDFEELQEEAKREEISQMPLLELAREEGYREQEGGETEQTKEREGKRRAA